MMLQILMVFPKSLLMASIEDKKKGEMERWFEPGWPLPRTLLSPLSLEVQSPEECHGCTVGKNL